MHFILLALLLALYGCSTNFSEPGLPAGPNGKASYYLKLSEQAPPSEALNYRLHAADHFIQAKNLNEAQRVLRAIQINTADADPSLRRTILETRLALLKKDFVKAHTLLAPTLAELKPVIPPNAIDSNATPGSFTAESTNQQSPASASMANGLKIALLLPSKGPHAEAAKTVRDGFLAGYYKTKQRHPNLTASIKIYDTGGGNQIKEAYEKALSENAQIIVGPLTKPEVQVLAHQQNINIPVLALNTISENASVPKQLYQFGLMPEDEVVAVAEQALRQKHRRALILAPQSEWGQRLVNTFKSYWQSKGGSIASVKFFNPAQELSPMVREFLITKHKEMRKDADMIFLVATAETARKIKPILNNYHIENLAVYATSSVYSGTPAPSQDQDLNGIHFCDMPWVLQQSASLQETYQMTAKLWPGSSNRAPRFFALGMDAYQLAEQLASTNNAGLSSGFNGVTGALRLTPYRRVQRDLVCAKFEQGLAVAD